jgi:hypothetical protein
MPGSRKDSPTPCHFPARFQALALLAREEADR